MVIEWVRVTKSEFNTVLKEHNWEPNSCGAFHLSDDGINHTIYILHHASTNFRLHELGHCVNGHGESRGVTYGEIARRELEADAFVCSKMGKPYNTGMIERPVLVLVAQAGCRVTDTFKWAIDNLQEYFPVTKKHKSILWDYIICYYREHRKQKREGTLLW